VAKHCLGENGCHSSFQNITKEKVLLNISGAGEARVMAYPRRLIGGIM
jgi:hypothetical protein